jgi:FXSXX-COOH protein
VSSSDRPLDDEVTALPRLLDVPLENLIDRKDTALNKAVERVRQEASYGAQNYAAHTSSPVMEPPEILDQARGGKELNVKVSWGSESDGSPS